MELAIEKIWLKIILKKIWFFWNEEREKQQNDTKLKIFRKSNTNFRKIFKEKHKEDTKLRIFKDQKETKKMQIRKLKEKQKHAIDTKLKIWN